LQTVVARALGGVDTDVLHCADLLRARTSPDYRTVLVECHGVLGGDITVTDADVDEIVEQLVAHLARGPEPPPAGLLYLLGKTGHPGALATLCRVAEELLNEPDDATAAVTYQVLCSLQDCAEAAGDTEFPSRLIALHQAAVMLGDHQISELADGWLRSSSIRRE